MKREDFIKIIRLRSCWRIDKRRGDYTLPSGDRLSSYVCRIVKSQMKVDNLQIRENGELCFGKWNDDSKYYELYPDFQPNEKCSFIDMQNRIEKLIYEIVRGY